MADICDCGSEIVHPPTGGRRSRCEACSPRRPQPKRKAPVLQLAQASSKAADATPSTRQSLTTRTLDELTGAGRVSTWQGEAALGLAELFDGGSYTAQGAAALIKAHRDALELAMQGAGSDADVIDMIFGEQA